MFISDTLHQRFKDDLLSPEPSSAVEREVFEVILAKEPEYGIGITIVGGDSNRQHDLGMFVKSVTVNGPAHRDSRIKPGDRILAINDRGVEGLPHHKAVKIIKKSSSHVKLKISQVKPPRSLRKKDNDDPLFQMKLKGSFISEPEKDENPLDTKSSPSDRKSSPSQGADEITTPVINVEDCASVYSEEVNVENDKKIDGQMRSIPDDVIVVTDDGLRNQVDVHSTLSQLDSLNSELAEQELPASEQNSK